MNTTITLAIIAISGMVIWIINQDAHAFTTDSDEEIANQYCIDHASDILQGKNPLSDLMLAGLISRFEGKTCSDVDAMITENSLQKAHRDLMCEMAECD